MKQRGQLSRSWIDAGDIGPLVLVAMQATPGQVVQDRFASMLLSDDVVHLKRQWIENRQNPTVIAPVSGEFANLFDQ